jgi:hypothetical protein
LPADNSLISLNGPATLTTQWPSAPLGIYYPPPKNLRIRLKHQRTAFAVASGFTNIDAISYGGGLIDKDTVRFYLEGEFRNAIFMAASTPSGWGLPLITTANMDPLGQANFGFFDSPGVDTAYDIKWPAISIQASAGPLVITFASTYGLAANQEIIVTHTGVAGRALIFPIGGSRVGVRQPRALVNPGDRIRFRWDEVNNKLVELDFSGPESYVFPLTYASTVTPDFGKATDFEVTLTGNVTLADPSNITVGQSGTIRLTQDATGSRIITYGSKYKFPGGASGGVLSTTANATDLLSYVVGANGNLYCTLAKALA